MHHCRLGFGGKKMTASGSTTQRKREHCILTIRKKSIRGKTGVIPVSMAIEVYHLLAQKLRPEVDKIWSPYLSSGENFFRHLCAIRGGVLDFLGQFSREISAFSREIELKSTEV